MTKVVESSTSAVACRTGGADCERRLSLSLSPRSPLLRLSPPLIEPDVTISVIRLSDGLHGRHAQARPRKSIKRQNAQLPEDGRDGELPIPGSVQDARAYYHVFFPWYNTEHYHAGLVLLTPADVHHGLAEQRVAARATVLATAYAAHPERFPASLPHPPAGPTEVWINPPGTARRNGAGSEIRPEP